MDNLIDAEFEAAEARGQAALETEPPCDCGPVQPQDRPRHRRSGEWLHLCVSSPPRAGSERGQSRRAGQRRGRWDGLQPALAEAGRRCLCACAGGRRVWDQRLDEQGAGATGRAVKVARQGRRSPRQWPQGRQTRQTQRLTVKPVFIRNGGRCKVLLPHHATYRYEENMADQLRDVWITRTMATVS